MSPMPTVKALVGRDAPPRPAGGFDVVGLGQNAVDVLVEMKNVSEVAVGLALIVALYRKRQSAHTEDLTSMKL